VALLGGTAPYLQTWLRHAGHPELFGFYAATAMVITLTTVCTLPETRAIDLRTVRSATAAP
jgi:MHS family alpha-ketoglutarate permease-like MFS transporter